MLPIGLIRFSLSSSKQGFALCTPQKPQMPRVESLSCRELKIITGVFKVTVLNLLVVMVHKRNTRMEFNGTLYRLSGRPSLFFIQSSPSVLS